MKMYLRIDPLSQLFADNGIKKGGLAEMRRSKITFIKVSHRTSTIAIKDNIDVDEEEKD